MASRTACAALISGLSLAGRDSDIVGRSSILMNLAEILRINIEQYAPLICLEMGKPIMQGFAEVLCEWYSVHTTDICSLQSTQNPDDKVYIAYLPIGPDSP